jgi:nicotinate phosphoribosyltransferase
MSSLKLTSSERTFLEENCPYLKSAYLDYLSKYTFQSEQVKIELQPSRNEDESGRGQLRMHTEGSWLETILWEVPLMSALSEAYFETDDVDWNYNNQEGVFPLSFPFL